MTTHARIARTVLLAAVALAAFASSQAQAATLPAGSTSILSGAPSLFGALPIPVSASEVDPSSVSADGRYVAFSSLSDGLLEGDDDRVSNVYVKDRTTGSVTLVSRATGPAGEPAHATCGQPAISDDGARVGFVCQGQLDPGDTNTHGDVYVREVAANRTVLVSRVGGLGPAGNGPSESPVLSANGDVVAFNSSSANLDPAANTGFSQVYVRRLGGGDPTNLVSRRSASAGGARALNGFEPSISDDGAKVAFSSTDGTLDSGDNNGQRDVFLRDVSAQTTSLVSRADGATGPVGNGPSQAPALAGDGSSVAFESRANQFDNSNDSDTQPDIYRRALAAKVTALVSINAGGGKGQDSTGASIDRSGDRVGFVSRATALHPADDNPSADAYVKNLATNVVEVASRASGPNGTVANANANSVALSGDGSTWVSRLESGRIVPGAEPRASAVVARTASGETSSVARPAGSAPFVNGGGRAESSAISADGRFVAFESGGVGLPDGVARGIVVRDLVTGSLTFASRADGPAGAAFGGIVANPAISADGRRVAFEVPTGSPAVQQVWVRDLAAGRSSLASRADGPIGASGDGSSTDPALDADGSRVSFASRATNLGNGDSDSELDVHVRDLSAGRTILASRAAGASGAKGNGSSTASDLNADGTRVVFSTSASNLGGGDNDAMGDVHLRDVAANTTRLVSATPAGTKGDGESISPSIDASGQRIAFGSTATNLGGGAGAEYRAYVRDLAGRSLALASRADGRNGRAAEDGRDATISPDGGFVAFSSLDRGLVPNPAVAAQQVYRRDLAAGRTELASRRGGAGAAATRGAVLGDISDRGGCVAFETADGLLGPTNDFVQVYLRAFSRDCAPGTPAGPGAPGGPGSPAGPTGRDTAAPRLSRVRLSPRRFRVRRPGRSSRRRGSRLRLRSSEAARLTIVVERVTKRRRTRIRRVGRITRRVAAGAGRIQLTGRLGRRRLVAGRYRLRITARDSAGNVSRPVKVSFRVLRG